MIIVLIGHGASATGGARFNLPGPDLTAPEFGALIGKLAACQVVFVNTASASGGFIAALSGPNRVVITATRTEGERNQARFGEYFAEAMASEEADADKDGRVSMLEAFEFAKRRVEELYKRDGQLLTEHALLDDNGDGVAAEAAGQPGADGALARSIFLASGERAAELLAGSADPELRALVARRISVEEQIAVLRAAKDKMEAADYDRQLEQLAIELARINRCDSGEAETMNAARMIALVTCSATVGTLALAQPPGRGSRFGQQSGEPFQLDRSSNPAAFAPSQVPYDGRFVFARLRFNEGVSTSEFGGGRFGRRGGRGQGPPWSHDYPRAETQLQKILKEITTIDPYSGPLGGNIIEIGSPDLFKYPIAYMAEPGFWTQTDQEAANLRAYLTKGGFIIFDDFRGNDWDNFETQMKRVLPEVRMVELDLSNPVFHSFFDVATLDFKQYYDRGQAVFMGAYERQRPRQAPAVHRQLQQRRRRVLGVVRHGLHADRPEQ